MESSDYHKVQKAANVDVLGLTPCLLLKFVVWILDAHRFAVPEVLRDHPVNCGFIRSIVVG